MERDLHDGVNRIGKHEYVNAFPELKHVFLVGNLQKPCPHPFIRDERLELIVCSYLPGDDGLLHWHRNITEYELVIEGEIGVFEVESGETHWFTAWDLIVIPAGKCVQRIVRRATKTVTVKVPSSADKVHCAQCSRACWRRVESYREETECE